MNSCAQQESASIHTDLNINKCALKLLGFEFGNFTDEELLEFISYYVPPSAIKALFYDSYNKFYVLHLSDIESTSILIGKNLRFGADHVSFLPLLDCFVVGNVYPNLSNNDIAEIFSAFGKVFDVTNYHALPNSSKFFHVLSGTREVSFLLTGCESEVQIPQHVVHSPYTFHTQPLCVGCQTQGHSLLNCPDKVEGEVSIPDRLQSYSSVDNNMVQEMIIEDVKTVKSIPLEKHVENSLLEKPEENIQIQKHEDNNLLEKPVENMLCQKPVDFFLFEAKSIEADVSVGKELPHDMLSSNSLDIEAEEKSKIILLAKKNNALPDVVKVKHPSSSKKIILKCPSVKSCLMKSKGVIPVDALDELLHIDARNKTKLLSYVFQFTSNIKDVLVQLSDLHKELDLMADITKDRVKFMQKILTVTRVLGKVLHDSY